MAEDTDLLSGALGPESGTAYRLSLAIAERYHGKGIVEGFTSTFNLREFESAGLCEVRQGEGAHAQFVREWSRGGVTMDFDAGTFEVTWESKPLVVIRAHWSEGYQQVARHWVIADDVAGAEAFAVAVSAYCNDPHKAVMLFNGSCWNKSRELWNQVQASSFDDLVLADDLGGTIREDFAAFLAARETYARYGVPWKRGVLFTGPPGNGKTHCLRALMRFLAVPCLYVQSLRTMYEPEDANIARVFERAREVSPCCLIFEDLDAMINAENRSVFLNQLDGFSNSAGLITLATTNHPERLDPAILDRPSRFDRRYAFALPGPVERARYVRAWSERLDPPMRVPDDAQRDLVELTDGFSFAYLKELFLSSTQRWMRHGKEGAMPAILREQATALRAQIAPSEGKRTRSPTETAT